MKLPSEIPYAIIDAFVEGPFSGNPAAVCPLPAWLPDDILQAMAAQHNLAETSYFVPADSGVWELRWFTPTTEVPLCGHATLAAAHYLWKVAGFEGERIEFQTRSRGTLTIERSGDWLEMDFPIDPVHSVPIQPEWRERFGDLVSAAVSDAGYLLLEAKDVETVKSYRLDLSYFANLEANCVVLAAATGGSHPAFVSRFFAPRKGVPEDSVTGSAHCVLFPWYSEKLGQSRLEARQISTRGGLLKGFVSGDRVILGGQARTYATGTILGQI